MSDNPLASVVFRGKARARITLADYNDAIQELQDAKTQLEPDGDNCHVCGDSGHQAWECHHNPLVMARMAAEVWLCGESAYPWRCFHCGEIFRDIATAQEHFGVSSAELAKCLQEGDKVPTQSDFDITIGALDRVLSKLVLWGKSVKTEGHSVVDEPNAQTLKHHAEDMIAAGEKILKDLASKDVEGTPQPQGCE